MKLHQKLLAYGRQRGWDLVNGHFRPEVRKYPKYQQWKRLVERSGIREMTDKEKAALHPRRQTVRPENEIRQQ